MNREDLEHLTPSGESLTVEFKRSTGQLRRAGETLCGMLNTGGGRVLIGVTDDGAIAGQLVTDRTLREVAAMLAEFEPSARSSRALHPRWASRLAHDPKQRALFLTRLGGGAGADITHVQRILGHSQITTTAEYAKDCAGAIEKKHPREKEYRRKK